MNNKIYLMAAILAFASVGALLTQPTLASAQSSMIENILDSALPTNNNNNNTPTRSSSSSTSEESPSSADATPVSTSLSCGQVVKVSVKLTANLNCKTDGIIVGADGITVDLNGFTIAGPGGDSSKVGIMLANNDDVQVTGGSITDFQAGVLNTGGSDNKISKVTFTKNQIAIFKQTTCFQTV